jgi:hypothetical protein
MRSRTWWNVGTPVALPLDRADTAPSNGWVDDCERDSTKPGGSLLNPAPSLARQDNLTHRTATVERVRPQRRPIQCGDAIAR